MYKKMKKTRILWALSLILGTTLGAVSCNNDTGSTEVEDDASLNKVQKIFKEMKNNNYTVEVGYYHSDPIKPENTTEKITQTVKYTDYSVESTGDFDNFYYAQKDGVIFKYKKDKSGNITASAPYINSNTGLRYESYFDFRVGFGDFDYKDVALTDLRNGKYSYEFGKNKNNDKIIEMIVRNQSSLSITPIQTTIEAIGNSLNFEFVAIAYDLKEGETFDITKNKALIFESKVYDIGTTENKEIKTYLDSGKSAYEPLDMRFSKLLFPYFNTHNYTVDIDGSGTTSESGLKDYIGTYEFEENAYCFSYPEGDSRGKGGAMEYLGYVSSFTFDALDKTKINILAIQKDSDAIAYESLYQQVLYSFDALSLGAFMGYKDPEVTDRYHITDASCIYYLAAIFNLQISDHTQCKDLIIDIDDYASHKFTATFNLSDETNKVDLGVLKATFRDVNNTKITGLKRFMNKGKDPVKDNQSIDDLKSALNLFKNNNYTMDVISSDVGVIHRLFTSKYVFSYVASQPTNNYGYIKIDENTIYEFTVDSKNQVVVDESENYALHGMTLPGHGQYLSDSTQNDDAGGYISTFDEIYNFDKYKIDESRNYNYWQNISAGFGKKMLEYVSGGLNISNLVRISAGFNTTIGEDPFDTRVSLSIFYARQADGLEGSTTLTFYNIGNTKFDSIDKYIENNIK